MTAEEKENCKCFTNKPSLVTNRERELKLNRAVLKETILKDEAYWKNQLGVK